MRWQYLSPRWIYRHGRCVISFDCKRVLLTYYIKNYEYTLPIRWENTWKRPQISLVQWFERWAENTEARVQTPVEAIPFFKCDLQKVCIWHVFQIKLINILFQVLINCSGDQGSPWGSGRSLDSQSGVPGSIASVCKSTKRNSNQIVRHTRNEFGKTRVK